MMNDYVFFQNEIEKIQESKIKPSLLLHTCCAMCFSSAYMQLKDYFNITVYFYNPNIYPESEYEKRKAEVIRLIGLFNEEFQTNVNFIEKKDNFECYLAKKVHKKACIDCFHLRILNAFIYANENQYDYCTTTLTVGRLKDSYLINRIGESLQPMFNQTRYLYSDFKKNKGIDISLTCKEKYHIYAQNYCGCELYYQK